MNDEKKEKIFNIKWNVRVFGENKIPAKKSQEAVNKLYNDLNSKTIKINFLDNDELEIIEVEEVETKENDEKITEQ